MKKFALCVAVGVPALVLLAFVSILIAHSLWGALVVGVAVAWVWATLYVTSP